MKNTAAHLNMISAMKMKPNFSELARIYGVDRRTGDLSRILCFQFIT